MSKMVPLEIPLLNEGMFQQEIEKEFEQLQGQILAFTKKYQDDAKGKKAKLTIEVEMKCEDPKHDFFSITTNIKKTLPQIPAKVTTGIGDVKQTGEMALFVRDTGSSYDTPKQHLIPMEEKKDLDKEEQE